MADTSPLTPEAVAQMVAKLNATNAHSPKSMDGYEYDAVGFRDKLCASAADTLTTLAAENATLRDKLAQSEKANKADGKVIVDVAGAIAREASHDL